MKKKILSIILCTFVIFSFVGCKSKELTNDQSKKTEVLEEEKSKESKESEKDSKENSNKDDSKKEENEKENKDENSNIEDTGNKYSNMTEEEIIKEANKDTKTIEVIKDKTLTPESIQEEKDNIKKYNLVVSQETLDSLDNPKDMDEIGMTDEELEEYHKNYVPVPNN